MFAYVFCITKTIVDLKRTSGLHYQYIDFSINNEVQYDLQSYSSPCRYDSIDWKNGHKLKVNIFVAQTNIKGCSWMDIYSNDSMVNKIGLIK